MNHNHRDRGLPQQPQAQFVTNYLNNNHAYQNHRPSSSSGIPATETASNGMSRGHQQLDLHQDEDLDEGGYQQIRSASTSNFNHHQQHQYGQQERYISNNNRLMQPPPPPLTYKHVPTQPPPALPSQPPPTYSTDILPTRSNLSTPSGQQQPILQQPQPSPNPTKVQQRSTPRLALFRSNSSLDLIQSQKPRYNNAAHAQLAQSSQLLTNIQPRSPKFHLKLPRFLTSSSTELKSSKAASKDKKAALASTAAGEPSTNPLIFAHYDFQSICTKFIKSVSTLERLNTRRRNTVTGASLASAITTTTAATATINSNCSSLNSSSSTMDENERVIIAANGEIGMDCDFGDGKSNHLVLSCPFFRNEIGYELEHIPIGLTHKNNHSASTKLDYFDRTAANHQQKHRPKQLTTLAIFEQSDFWVPNKCPFKQQVREEHGGEDNQEEENECVDEFNNLIEEIDLGKNYYKNYFYQKPHENWLIHDLNYYGPICISLKREQQPSSSNNSSTILRIILRTTELSTLRVTCIEPEQSSQSQSQHILTKDILLQLLPKIQLGSSSSTPAATATQATKIYKSLPSLPEQLLKFDNPTSTSPAAPATATNNSNKKKRLKIGILYCARDQSTEEEMYNNEFGSTDFVKFLSLIGQRVRLKGFHGYAGGLDTKDDTSGLYSIYKEWNNYEIMFHVSTMLPYSTNNRQQLMRKRHIGNDIVTIIYQEHGSKPFTPKNIRSQFQHVFVIVQKTGIQQYTLAITRSYQVPLFGPRLPKAGVFNVTNPKQVHRFLTYLLTKLLNGEQMTTARSDKFKQMTLRTREELLKELCRKYSSEIVLEFNNNGHHGSNNSSSSAGHGLKKFNIFKGKCASSKGNSTTNSATAMANPAFSLVNDSASLSSTVKLNGAICYQIRLIDEEESEEDSGGYFNAIPQQMTLLVISRETLAVIKNEQLIFAIPTFSILAWDLKTPDGRWSSLSTPNDNNGLSSGLQLMGISGLNNGLGLGPNSASSYGYGANDPDTLVRIYYHQGESFTVQCVNELHSLLRRLEHVATIGTRVVEFNLRRPRAASATSAAIGQVVEEQRPSSLYSSSVPSAFTSLSTNAMSLMTGIQEAPRFPTYSSTTGSPAYFSSTGPPAAAGPMAISSQAPATTTTPTQLGFHIQSNGIITTIEQNSIAFAIGLQKNSRVVEINQQPIIKMLQYEMINLLKTQPVLTLKVILPSDGNVRYGCWDKKCTVAAALFGNKQQHQHLQQGQLLQEDQTTGGSPIVTVTGNLIESSNSSSGYGTVNSVGTDRHGHGRLLAVGDPGLVGNEEQQNEVEYFTTRQVGVGYYYDDRHHHRRNSDEPFGQPPSLKPPTPPPPPIPARNHTSLHGTNIGTGYGYLNDASPSPPHMDHNLNGGPASSLLLLNGNSRKALPIPLATQAPRATFELDDDYLYSRRPTIPSSSSIPMQQAAAASSVVRPYPSSATAGRPASLETTLINSKSTYLIDDNAEFEREEDGNDLEEQNRKVLTKNERLALLKLSYKQQKQKTTTTNKSSKPFIVQDELMKILNPNPEMIGQEYQQTTRRSLSPSSQPAAVQQQQQQPQSQFPVTRRRKQSPVAPAPPNLQSHRQQSPLALKPANQQDAQGQRRSPQLFPNSTTVVPDHNLRSRNSNNVNRRPAAAAGGSRPISCGEFSKAVPYQQQQLKKTRPISINSAIPPQQMYNNNGPLEIVTNNRQQPMLPQHTVPTTIMNSASTNQPQAFIPTSSSSLESTSQELDWNTLVQTATAAAAAGETIFRVPPAAALTPPPTPTVIIENLTTRVNELELKLTQEQKSRLELQTKLDKLQENYRLLQFK